MSHTVGCVPTGPPSNSAVSLLKLLDKGEDLAGLAVAANTAALSKDRPNHTAGTHPGLNLAAFRGRLDFGRAAVAGMHTALCWFLWGGSASPCPCVTH